MRARLHRSAFQLAVLWVAVLPACSTASARRARPADSVLLRVENGQFEPVVVYVVRSGAELRVGLVEGLTSRTLRVPGAHVSPGAELALRAESPMPAQSQTSPLFHIEPGQTIYWIVRTAPTLSAFSIR